jgi:hypothetical protein
MACSISEEVERVDKDFHLQRKAGRDEVLLFIAR